MGRTDLIKWIPVIFVICVLAAACTTVPITGRKQLSLIPGDTILSMSYQQYDAFLKEHELSHDQKAAGMVKQVGKEIADAVETYLKQRGMEKQLRNYKWEFNLIKDDSVNAWCMPGGKVVVYEGIMPVAGDKNGLAVVMGHEIAHAVANHGSERMSQALLVQFGAVAMSEAMEQEPQTTRQLWMAAYGAGSQIVILFPYSRLQEKEADRLGLIFMAMAGYDPREAVDFWQRMMKKKDGKSPPEFLSTHPADDKRIAGIKQMLPEAMQYYRKRK
ncbi:MAG: M48 family metallopeptidase [Desulfobacteraceae bacterium]|nr:M48 family metallopeptidase [Desulfobacteraceae bacterium]